MNTAPAPAPNLDGMVLEAWQSYLDATRLLLEQLDSRLEAEAGISLADYGVLDRLAEADEWGLRMSDLADSAVFSRSRISHAVDRLETLGWVQRKACPTDRRGSYASLTETGRAKLAEAHPGYADTVCRHLFDQLSDDDLVRFRAMMDAVKSTFERPTGPGMPRPSI